MTSFKTTIEPFKIKSVEPIKMTTEKERQKYLEESGYNVFNLKADDVLIDLLTDSGTSAMSEHQWGKVMEGDESYAGSDSWYRMKNVITRLTGIENILPVHQGKDKYFYSNTHFDTTRANVEYTGAEAIDISVQETCELHEYHPFKGDLDTKKLKNQLENGCKEKIGGVILTMTNNSGGGQPVSMKNVKEVSSLCKKFETPLFIDCCRIAENAWFIKEREEGYKNMSPSEIARKVFNMADGALMSAKKDGLVNMGGFMAMKDNELYEKCKEKLIITEGYLTYGGLSGRD
ncbi:MAG: tryptophanase, partial [Flavobacteriales bacterium]